MAKTNKPGEWGNPNIKTNKPGAWGAEKKDGSNRTKNPFASVKAEQNKNTSTDFDGPNESKIKSVDRPTKEQSSAEQQTVFANAEETKLTTIILPDDQASVAVNSDTADLQNEQPIAKEAEQSYRQAYTKQSYSDTVPVKTDTADLQSEQSIAKEAEQSWRQADTKQSYSDTVPAKSDKQTTPAPVKKKSPLKALAVVAFIIIIALVAFNFWYLQRLSKRFANQGSNSALQASGNVTAQTSVLPETAAPTPTQVSTPTPSPTLAPTPTPSPTPDNLITLSQDNPQMVLLKEAFDYTINGFHYNFKCATIDNWDPTISVTTDYTGNRTIKSSFFKTYALVQESGKLLFIGLTVDDDYNILDGLYVCNYSGNCISSQWIDHFAIKKNDIPKYSDGKILYSGRFALLKEFKYTVSFGINFNKEDCIESTEKKTKELKDKAYKIRAKKSATVYEGKLDELSSLVIKKGDIFTVEKFAIDGDGTYAYIRRQSDNRLFCVQIYSMCTDSADIEEYFEYNGGDDYSDSPTGSFLVSDLFELA